MKMHENKPSLERITFRGRCPACGEGKIFKTILMMHERCTVCGLNLGAREIGDGPAFFGIVIIGALAAIGAAVMESVYMPPYWVHAVVWGAFIIVGSLVVLRLAKAFLLGVQYHSRPEDFR